MAWRSHGTSNFELVQNLFKNKLFNNERVREAMLAVDRADFVDVDPYMDCPQPIGYGATISAPHMHAAALEALAGPNGKAIGIEHMEQLVKKSFQNLEKHHSEKLDRGQIEIVGGDGRLGYPQGGPYDAIHVGAAAPDMPETLIDQLKNGGRMVIPVGRQYQEFLQIDKTIDGRVEKRKLMDVIYVPLTSQEHQLRR
ncbi:hypothetical protein FO519_003315 [Halicephalobus sp. NKZ332]|nr:hypothetical protein FO519_003315 [Halicephalobus sp. NKZ332]